MNGGDGDGDGGQDRLSPIILLYWCIYGISFIIIIFYKDSKELTLNYYYVFGSFIFGSLVCLVDFILNVYIYCTQFDFDKVYPSLYLDLQWILLFFQVFFVVVLPFSYSIVVVVVSNRRKQKQQNFPLLFISMIISAYFLFLVDIFIYLRYIL